jgi:hypothetical protein
MFPVEVGRKKRMANWIWVLLILSLLSCGKKANPVAPTKVIPKGVTDLGYQIKGKFLVLSWTIPSQNTDGSPLTDLKGFDLKKGEWATKDFCATCPDRFQETLRIDLKGPEVAGLKITSDQMELTEDNLKPGYTYSYQVLAVTKRETVSEPSKILRVAWDLPLMPPSALELKPHLQGLEISWAPPQALADGSAPEGLAGYSLYRRTGKGPWVKVNDKPIEKPVYIDSGLQEGVQYTYRVKALRQIQGTLLESETSEEKETVFTRVGPPMPVQDLIAISNPKGIQIRWEATETMTPSGYYVYRRMEDEKMPKRITPEPIKDSIFEDVNVVPGKAYLYSVSVVGGPPALLEGQRSKEVRIIFTP